VSRKLGCSPTALWAIAAISRGDDFLADEVEAYDPGPLSLVNAAANSLSDFVVQVA
jgi:hypothetical protein